MLRLEVHWSFPEAAYLFFKSETCCFYKVYIWMGSVGCPGIREIILMLLYLVLFQFKAYSILWLFLKISVLGQPYSLSYRYTSSSFFQNANRYIIAYLKGTPKTSDFPVWKPECYMFSAGMGAYGFCHSIHVVQGCYLHFPFPWICFSVPVRK